VLIDGSPIAFYQVLLKNLPLVGTVARINRGPLCLPTFPLSPNNLTLLYRYLYREWVLKNRGFLTIAPNVSSDLLTEEELRQEGFLPGSEPPWQSGWLPLQQDEETLRKALLQKWRNLLNKSEKMGMELHPVADREEMEDVLGEYDRFMKLRNFQSTSSALIRAIYHQSPDLLYTLVAQREGRYLGAVIIARHGRACTYLVGMTSEEGRRANANYFLLWNGLLHCRRTGSEWFDVGGIDEIHTPRIAHFKKGLGFSPYRLIGEYEGYRGLRYGLLSKLKKFFHSGLPKKSHGAAGQTLDP
jgi:lipid II:glycine glycyltransferase (peptidoglycan interpeptide bridge formation enzyme)